nr:unnamed protein product [Digitaria exilis]
MRRDERSAGGGERRRSGAERLTLGLGRVPELERWAPPPSPLPGVDGWSDPIRFESRAPVDRASAPGHAKGPSLARVFGVRSVGCAWRPQCIYYCCE